MENDPLAYVVGSLFVSAVTVAFFLWLMPKKYKPAFFVKHRVIAFFCVMFSIMLIRFIAEQAAIFYAQRLTRDHIELSLVSDVRAAADLSRLDEMDIRDLALRCIQIDMLFRMQVEISAGEVTEADVLMLVDQHFRENPEILATVTNSFRIVSRYADTERKRLAARRVYMRQCKAGEGPDGLVDIIYLLGPL